MSRGRKESRELETSAEENFEVLEDASKLVLEALHKLLEALKAETHLNTGKELAWPICNMIHAPRTHAQGSGHPWHPQKLRLGSDIRSNWLGVFLEASYFSDC